MSGTNGKLSGIVYDIQRGAVNDGPGIRTTVFLKGCPLRCIWCHNPESQQSKPQLRFYPDKCRNYLECVSACPTDTHIAIDGKHTVRFERCTLSGECISACPNDALEIVGKEMSVSEVLDIVEKDRRFYEESGGGITLSGGEPMLQFEYTKQLLFTAKNAGIHTTVDTSGYASRDHFAEILPATDLFLYDYKVTDPAMHKDLTGVSNELILGNLEYLYHKGAKIILRCPLIQTVNDGQKHLRAIANLREKYPKLEGIEIMPFHNMGRKKAREIGLDRDEIQLGTTPDETKARWSDLLEEFGLAEVVMN